MTVNLDKLAAQSLVYIDTGLDDGKELIFSKEKFAELIVRECTTIAQEYDGVKLSGPGMIIAGRIETHFGIEE